MIESLIKSFAFAFTGIGEALLCERNFRLQWLMALMASLVIYIVHFELLPSMFLLALIFLVLALELLNSSIEKMCDSSGFEYHPLKQKAKDFAAASVLLAALLSLLVFFSFAYGMREGIFFMMSSNPLIAISGLLIFMCHVPLCLISNLSPYALLLIVPSLTLHLLIITTSTGPILFLGLSAIFHLSLILAHIKRACAAKS